METTINIPENVKITTQDAQLIVTGANATSTRKFSHPRITITKDDNIIKIKTDSPQRKDRAVIGTWTTHIKNMLYGAENDFKYTLKILYTHFPITLKVQDDLVVISNFMGEKGTRRAKIHKDVKVNIQKDTITITGPSKDDVGQTAANLEQATKQKSKDIRIYQDGVYITKKG